MKLGSPIKCMICGTMFPKWSANQKTCSRKCSKERAKRYEMKVRGQSESIKECRYCGDLYTPTRINSPCCERQECRAKHKKLWYEGYYKLKAPRYAPEGERKPRKQVAHICRYCGLVFQNTASTGTVCHAEECRDKYNREAKERAKAWNEKHKDKKTAWAAERRRTTSASLSEAPPSLREIIMEQWIDTVFDLRDQVLLVFQECQHIRGVPSDMIYTLLREGFPSQCSSMRTLNHHRHP